MNIDIAKIPSQFGAGTTGLVAACMGHSAIMAELNASYLEIAKARLTQALSGKHAFKREVEKDDLFTLCEGVA